MQGLVGFGDLMAGLGRSVSDLCPQTLLDGCCCLVHLVLNRARCIVKPLDRALSHLIGNLQTLIQGLIGLGNLIADPGRNVIALRSQTFLKGLGRPVQLGLDRARRIVQSLGHDLFHLVGPLQTPMQALIGLGTLIAGPSQNVIDLCPQTLLDGICCLVQLVLNRARRIVKPLDRDLLHVLSHLEMLLVLNS
jgi:hypothetical protein